MVDGDAHPLCAVFPLCDTVKTTVLVYTRDSRAVTTETVVHRRIQLKSAAYRNPVSILHKLQSRFITVIVRRVVTSILEVSDKTHCELRSTGEEQIGQSAGKSVSSTRLRHDGYSKTRTAESAEKWKMVSGAKPFAQKVIGQ